jgi:hypothetical protein
MEIPQKYNSCAYLTSFSPDSDRLWTGLWHGKVILAATMRQRKKPRVGAVFRE